MLIVFSRPVWIGGGRISPVASYLGADNPWEDMLSADGDTIMSVIPGEIDAVSLSRIRGDRDVFDVVEIEDDNPPLRSGRPARRFKERKKPKPAKRPLPAAKREAVKGALARRGIPADAIPNNPSSEDALSLFEAEMILDQTFSAVELSNDMDRREMSIRMKEMGFDIDVAPGEGKRAAIVKALKKGRKVA